MRCRSPTSPTGWPAAEAGIWQGLLAPARTAPAVVERQYRAFAEALGSVRGRLAGLGAEIRAEEPESFRRWLAEETLAWGAVIRARGIRLD